MASDFHIQNPAYGEYVQRIFDTATFVKDLGITLAGVGEGWCEATLALAPRHAQQDGFAHAGVLATLADHTAGGAGGTLIHENETVLSIEFKVNLLRPAVGTSLRCRATVLRQGRTIIVAESEVFAVSAERTVLVSKATVTLAVVPRKGA